MEDFIARHQHLSGLSSVQLVTISGNVSSRNYQQMDRMLAQTVERSKIGMLDLTEIHQIDSESLRLICQWHRQALKDRKYLSGRWRLVD